MKEGWVYMKLGEVITNLRTGLNPRTHFKLNTPDAKGKYITVRELKGFTIEPDDKTDCVNDTALQRINQRSNLQIGDVLFSGTGTIGNTALVSEEPKTWNIKEGIYALTPKHNIIESRFLIYVISSDYFLFYAKDKAEGTGVRSIPMKRFVLLPIPVPPLPEQQRIVSYLDAEFAKIEALKANAETQLQAAKDLFQAALKELLTPKEGWVEKKLVVEFNLKSGDNLPTKDQKSGTIPVYGGNGITGYHDSYNLCGEQLLIGRVGALCGNIHYVNNKIWVTDNAFVVKNISENWNKKFLFYELDCLNLNQFASQTAQPVISNKSMKDVIVFQPNKEEQRAIAAQLDDLSAKVKQLQANYEQTITHCNDLKQSLLKKVFE